MKTKLQFAAIIASFFAFQMSAQNRTTINAMNSEISDNLDLTAVSSIFGESENLNDFERRLNDPKLQISNLDLNNDNRVDYLRVIESVENRTHVVVIQSVIGRDLYQDVATIEIEKDRSNRISIQIVGNAYIYGQNYIYEPEYCYTPQIYASFWASYYRPYYSTWTWNYYPTYYYAWNPYPIYRYRQNVYGCVNYQNTYNYVNYRRCYRAPAIYNSYSCNTYERQYPQYAFARRNSTISNRYELDQRRYNNGKGYRNEVANNRNNSSYSRNNTNYNSNTQREYTQYRTNTAREGYTPRAESQRDYTQNRVSTQRTEPQREYTQNRTSSPREISTQRAESQRDYSQNRNSTPRENNTQRAEPQRNYSQNRSSSPRENNTQRTESQRGNDYAGRGNNRRI
ncbi:MAG TPA: hypothetical protein VFS71_11850 [Flavobacterium sp.]|uniref:hypothetical protein n=1 Tax=Flavobacterium sp. TaxID=239 RepID=UPI002DBF0202|nr:hypothetical protein [Flavobacterium sp.]HEU4790372.1 hypothetical protein [Flavobacterium sp.]